MLIDLATTVKVQKRLEGTFYGTVIDNEDPKKHGAVRIEIPGLIEGPKESLPWATPKWPAFLGGSADAQMLFVPNVDSQIAVEFDEDVYTLYYHAWSGSDPKKNEELLADYPKTYGWVDEEQNCCIINREKKTYLMRHSSGSYIEMKEGGIVTVYATEELIINVDGPTSVNTKGDTTVMTEGDTAVTTGGNTSVNTSGTTVVNSSGDAVVNSSSNATLSSSGVTTVTGSVVIIG